MNFDQQNPQMRFLWSPVISCNLTIFREKKNCKFGCCSKSINRTVPPLKFWPNIRLKYTQIIYMLVISHMMINCQKIAWGGSNHTIWPPPMRQICGHFTCKWKIAVIFFNNFWKNLDFFWIRLYWLNLTIKTSQTGLKHLILSIWSPSWR